MGEAILSHLRDTLEAGELHLAIGSLRQAYIMKQQSGVNGVPSVLECVNDVSDPLDLAN